MDDITATINDHKKDIFNKLEAIQCTLDPLKDTVETLSLIGDDKKGEKNFELEASRQLLTHHAEELDRIYKARIYTPEETAA